MADTLYANAKLPDTTAAPLNISTADANKFQGGQTGLAASGWQPVTNKVDVSANTGAGYNAGLHVDPNAGKTPTNTLDSSLANADHNDTQANIDQRNKDLITQQQSNLAMTNANEINGINNAYNVRDRQLKNTQGEESLTNTATQFRLGREATDYANSATQKLDQLHTDQINQLTSERQNLIAKANQAMRDGNTTLAKQLIDADQAALDRQDKLKAEAATQKAQDTQNQINTVRLGTDTSKAAQDHLSQIATSGADASTINPDDKATFEKQIGLPAGGFDAYYKATQATTNAKTQSDLIKAQTDVLDLVSKIPAGQTIKIGDATYTGTQVNKDIKTLTEVDNAGHTTVVSYKVDPITGKPTVLGQASLGQIGKGLKGTQGGGGGGGGGTGGGQRITPKNLSASTATYDAQLKAAAGGEGYVTKEDWNDAMTAWEKDGGTRKQFVNSFSKFANARNGYDYVGLKPTKAPK